MVSDVTAAQMLRLAVRNGAGAVATCDADHLDPPRLREGGDSTNVSRDAVLQDRADNHLNVGAGHVVCAAAGH